MADPPVFGPVFPPGIGFAPPVVPPMIMMADPQAMRNTVVLGGVHGAAGPAPTALLPRGMPVAGFRQRVARMNIQATPPGPGPVVRALTAGVGFDTGAPAAIARAHVNLALNIELFPTEDADLDL